MPPVSTTAPGPAASAPSPRQSPPEPLKGSEAVAKGPAPEAFADSARRQLRRALEDSRKFIERNALKARPIAPTDRAAATATPPTAERTSGKGTPAASAARPPPPLSRFAPVPSTAQVASDVYKAQNDAPDSPASKAASAPLGPVTSTTRVPLLAQARADAPPVSALVGGFFFPKQG